MARPSTLPTHPRQLVLNALRNSNTPLTAYDLLNTLSAHGIKHIPTIYRALEWLEKQGQVHKVKELGAYVACDCTQDHTHPVSALTVCASCSKVEELHDHKVLHALEKLSSLGVPLATNAVVELPVICNGCSNG